MQMQIQIDANPADTAVSEVSMMRIIMMMMMMVMIVMMMMITMMMTMIKVVAMTIIASKEVGAALFIAQVRASCTIMIILIGQ